MCVLHTCASRDVVVENEYKKACMHIVATLECECTTAVFDTNLVAF